MEKVVVQTGAKTYQIADQDGNDLGVFRFIPSDAGTSVSVAVLTNTAAHSPSFPCRYAIAPVTASFLASEYLRWKLSE